MGPLVWETRKKCDKKRERQIIENDRDGERELIEHSVSQGDEHIEIKDERNMSEADNSDNELGGDRELIEDSVLQGDELIEIKDERNMSEANNSNNDLKRDKELIEDPVFEGDEQIKIKDERNRSEEDNRYNNPGGEICSDKYGTEDEGCKHDKRWARIIMDRGSNEDEAQLRAN